MAVVGPGSDMEAVFAAKLVKGRRIAVTRYAEVKDLGPCHVLFIAADASGGHREALRAVEGRSVLTVADVVSAVGPSPMIALSVVEAKLTFHVNLDAVEAEGLQISSNLLGLAKSVQSSRLKRSPS